jgi:hypothetical protein
LANKLTIASYWQVFDDKMEKREQRAEVLIALLFVLLGGLTCLIALIVLYEKESPDDVLSGALKFIRSRPCLVREPP